MELNDLKYYCELVGYNPDDFLKQEVYSKPVINATEVAVIDVLDDLDFLECFEIEEVECSTNQELTEANSEALKILERQLKYEYDSGWLSENYKYLKLTQTIANKYKKGYNKNIWEDIEQEAKKALLIALDKFEVREYTHEHRHTHTTQNDLSHNHIHKNIYSYPHTHYHKHKHEVSIEYFIKLVVSREILNFIYSQEDMLGVSVRVRSSDSKILDSYRASGDVNMVAAKMNITSARVREAFYRPSIESLNIRDEDDNEFIDNVAEIDKNNFSRPTSYRESLLIEALSELSQEELILVSMYNEIDVVDKYTINFKQLDFGGIDTTKDTVTFEMIAGYLNKPKTTVIRNYKKALKKLRAFYGIKVVDSTSEANLKQLRD